MTGAESLRCGVLMVLMVLMFWVQEIIEKTEPLIGTFGICLLLSLWMCLYWAIVWALMKSQLKMFAKKTPTLRENAEEEGP